MLYLVDRNHELSSVCFFFSCVCEYFFFIRQHYNYDVTCVKKKWRVKKKKINNHLIDITHSNVSARLPPPRTRDKDAPRRSNPRGHIYILIIKTKRRLLISYYNFINYILLYKHIVRVYYYNILWC